MDLENIPWDQVGDFVCEVLTVTRRNWSKLRRIHPDVTFEQFAAAACAGGLKELFDNIDAAGDARRQRHRR